MSGSSSKGLVGSFGSEPPPGVYNGIDTGFSNPQTYDYSEFLKTTEAQGYLPQIAMAKRDNAQIFQTREGGYVSANAHDGMGGLNTQQDVTGFMGAFLKWQQTQQSENQAWESYSELAAQQQGRGQTILTGAAQTQYSSILASMGQPAIGTPSTPTIARPRTGAMGAPS